MRISDSIKISKGGMFSNRRVIGLITVLTLGVLMFSLAVFFIITFEINYKKNVVETEFMNTISYNSGDSYYITSDMNDNILSLDGIKDVRRVKNIRVNPTGSKSGQEPYMELTLDGEEVAINRHEEYNSYEVDVTIIEEGRLITEMDEARYAANSGGKSPLIFGRQISNPREILVTERLFNNVDTASLQGKKLSLSIDYFRYWQRDYSVDSDADPDNEYKPRNMSPINPENEFYGNISIFRDYTICGVISDEYAEEFDLGDIVFNSNDIANTDVLMRYNNKYDTTVVTYDTDNIDEYSKSVVDNGKVFPFILTLEDCYDKLNNEYCTVFFDSVDSLKAADIYMQSSLNINAMLVRHTDEYLSYVNKERIFTVIEQFMILFAAGVIIMSIYTFIVGIVRTERRERNYYSALRKIGLTRGEMIRARIVAVSILMLIVLVVSLLLSIITAAILDEALVKEDSFIKFVKETFDINLTFNISAIMIADMLVCICVYIILMSVTIIICNRKI